MTTRSLRGTLHGRRCDLRPMSRDDTDMVIAWRNDPLISKWFFSDTKFTVAAHMEWLSKRLESCVDFNWIIETKAHGPVGTLAIYNIDWREGRAEFGRFLIGEPAARKQGYGLEAMGILLNSITEVGIKCVYLHVKPDNLAALRLYSAVGFTRTSTCPGSDRMELSLGCSC